MERKASRQIVEQANTMLCRMQHRGGTGAVDSDGDGCGIMMALPDEYFRSLVPNLPPPGKYGVGNIFMPQSEERVQEGLDTLQRCAKEFELEVIHIREMPTCNTRLGPYAKSTEPRHYQIFVVDARKDISVKDSKKSVTHEDDDEMQSSADNRGSSDEAVRVGGSDKKKKTWRRASGGVRRRRVSASNIPHRSLEVNLFLMRRKAQTVNREFFVCSLSMASLTYKGQLSCDQLFDYFLDLQDPKCSSWCCLIHSRFSTNSFPSWQRAHPFRRICHNGEINTLEGNRNALASRESMMDTTFFPIEAITPVDEEIGGDSSLLDNVVELMNVAGRDLAECLMMLVPEPWQQDKTMQEWKRSFYEYRSMQCEPWDGPAFIAFFDGKQFGATLDRNGLRPGRWMVTQDNRVILSSEVGVVDVPESDILIKSRLMPGKMLMVDLEQSRIVEDEELKARYCKRNPYATWLKEMSLNVQSITEKLLPS
jgi:glutamate synthase domain-containing protein 1